MSAPATPTPGFYIVFGSRLGSCTDFGLYATRELCEQACVKASHFLGDECRPWPLVLHTQMPDYLDGEADGDVSPALLASAPALLAALKLIDCNAGCGSQYIRDTARAALRLATEGREA